jgi:hypothetical protein
MVMNPESTISEGSKEQYKADTTSLIQILLSGKLEQKKVTSTLTHTKSYMVNIFISNLIPRTYMEGIVESR